MTSAFTPHNRAGRRWIRASQESPPDNFLQKSRNRIELDHGQVGNSAARIARLPFRSRSRQGKKARKNFPAKIQRNQLISLDSRKSKEIQGNPTLIIGGFHKRNGLGQENPNR